MTGIFPAVLQVECVPPCRVAEGRCDEIIALLSALFHSRVREDQSRIKAVTSNLIGGRRRELENIWPFSCVCAFSVFVDRSADSILGTFLRP